MKNNPTNFVALVSFGRNPGDGIRRRSLQCPAASPPMLPDRPARIIEIDAAGVDLPTKAGLDAVFSPRPHPTAGAGGSPEPLTALRRRRVRLFLSLRAFLDQAALSRCILTLRALDQAGVSPTLISAGERKVDENPYTPLSKTAWGEVQAEVDKCYGLLDR